MGGVNSSALNSIPTLDNENKKLLEDEMDDYIALVVAVVPAQLVGKEPINGDMLKSEEIDLGWRKGWFSRKWYKNPPQANDVTVKNNAATLSIPLLLEDDIHGKSNMLVLDILRNPILLPMKDKFYRLESDESAVTLLEQLRLGPGQACPVPYHTWEEMSSDMALSRIFFYGIGSVLMHSQSALQHDNLDPELGPLVVDLDLSRYEVRPGYAKYGSRLHFDTEQNITAIYDYGRQKLVKPGEGQAWDRAKHVAKQTAITLITARNHLLWTHLLLSNAMTRAKSQELPPDHPLRRLLTVFSFRTNLVNNSATGSLIPMLSMSHRATAFTYESLTKIHLAGYTQCNLFQPFPQQEIGDELKKMSDAGTFPYHAEGVAWYAIVRSFVCEWIEKAGESCLSDDYAKKFFEALEAATKGQRYELSLETKDSQIDALAQMIWAVTAYHEIVGTVVEYTQRPSFMGFRALEDESVTTTDLQSFLIAMAVTAFTALRMPMLTDKFECFFGKGGAPSWEIEVWANFQKAIQEQSEKVQAADKERKTEFKVFDPARFECAVSL